MLVLGRGVGDKIIITDKRTGEQIEIFVKEIFIHPTEGKGVKLAFDAEMHYSIQREELINSPSRVYLKNKQQRKIERRRQERFKRANND